METITSIDNSKLKHVKKLGDKKYRAEYFEYVVEGARWISDALKTAPELFCAVFVKDSAQQKFAELLKLAENLIGAESIFSVSDAAFDKTADTEQSQGILAVLKFRARQAFPENPYCLYLDRIRDPGNLGTIIRTAVAAGFNDIVLDGCADVYAPKTVRSSMAALLRANYFVPECGGDFISAFKNSGYKVFAADMGGENIFTNKEKFDKICLIIGSEADGIRPEFLTSADKVFSIPMKNTESLNAAVSAGILMYQLSDGK